MIINDHSMSSLQQRRLYLVLSALPLKILFFGRGLKCLPKSTVAHLPSETSTVLFFSLLALWDSHVITFWQHDGQHVCGVHTSTAWTDPTAFRTTDSSALSSAVRGPENSWIGHGGVHTTDSSLLKRILTWQDKSNVIAEARKTVVMQSSPFDG